MGPPFTGVARYVLWDEWPGRLGDSAARFGYSAVSVMRLRILCTVIAAWACVIASHAQNAALDYTQWRGQQRDGSVSAFVEPATWPETLTRRWRVEVGDGYATPVIVGGTVYIFHAARIVKASPRSTRRLAA